MDLRDLRDIDNLCCLALLFAGGGIVGWIYEMLFYRINDGMFVQRGQGLGPWLPIYGFGSVFICLLAVRFEKSKIAVFLVSALVSGVLEYATGWVLYNLFGGLRWWDYNTEIWNWGNVNGYICARSVLLFGAAGVMLVYGIVPFLIRFLETHRSRKVDLLCTGLIVLWLADILVYRLLH